MPHMIRTSERRAFRGCRRRWDWAFRQGYTPQIEPSFFEFGRAFHSGMEEIYNPDTWTLTNPVEKLELAMKVFELECERQRKEYLRTTGLVRLDRDGQDLYDESIKLGHGMLEYYIAYVHVKHDDWFRPVKVEVEFEVPVKDEYGEVVRCFGSPGCGQNHSNDVDSDDSIVTYGGRVDCLVESIHDGGYWVLDWKTTAELRATEELLEMDDQICSYTTYLRNGCGIDIRGFVYVEIRKAFPQPPRLLSRARNGCLYSTDKRQPTTPELFISTVSDGDSSGYEDGNYDEFINWLKTSKDAAKFHQRFTIEKTPTEMDNIAWTIAEEAKDMTGYGPRIYPSVGRFSCPSCAYKSPCRMKFAGDDYLYTLDTMFTRIK